LLFGFSLCLHRLGDTPRLGLFCDSSRFRRSGPLPGLGLGQPSSLGFFRLALSFGFCLCLTASGGFCFRQAFGLHLRCATSRFGFRRLAARLRCRDTPLFFLGGFSLRLCRRGDASLFFLCRSPSRLLRGFSSSFLARCFAPSFFFGLTLRFFRGFSLGFFGS
jgi:hypothetical protein